MQDGGLSLKGEILTFFSLLSRITSIKNNLVKKGWQGVLIKEENGFVQYMFGMQEPAHFRLLIGLSNKVVEITQAQ